MADSTNEAAEANKQLLNKKNTNAVMQSVEQLSAKVYAQEERISAQDSAIRSLHEKVSALENMLRAQRAISFGNGPSVKE